MTTEQDRFRITQWILERQIGWIVSADVKVGAVVAIQTAMAGVLAAAFSSSNNRSEWAILSTVAAFACAIGAFVCASFALFPRVDGPSKSLLFFGRICSLSRSDYINEIRSATEAQILEDCAAQIHRNAEIASEKHRWVQAGMIWSFLAAPPWVIALLQLAPLKIS